VVGARRRHQPHARERSSGRLLGARLGVFAGLLLALSFGSGCSRPLLEPPDIQVRGDPSAAYEALLQEIVQPDGRVDYDRLEANREPLDRYVAWIAQSKRPRARSSLQHAFYLNAYNALVLYAVLAYDRPTSVWDVPGFTSKPGRFFYETSFVVQGQPMSLWEIEHERLRLRVLDYRDHSAMNCASWSCPPLRNTLYRERNLKGQLDDQMRRWIQDPERGVRIVDGKAEFSEIMKWFGDDFHRWSGGKNLCTVIAPYADGVVKAELQKLAREGCPHTFRTYDWRLNDVSSEKSHTP